MSYQGVIGTPWSYILLGVENTEPRLKQNQKGRIMPDPDVKRASPSNNQNNTGWCNQVTLHIVRKLLDDFASSSPSVDVKHEQSSLLQLHVMMSDYIYYGTFQTSLRFLVHDFK